VALAVTTIVLLLVASLDVVQKAFCVHLIAFCITCTVLVWTKDSRNAFRLSLGFPVCHFVLLLCIIWDCEPLFFVLKLALISCLWFGTRLMRITGARLIYALDHKPKSRVRVTIVQLLIGASLVLMASLHLAYEHVAFSFAEMALWGCFLVDVLWYFGIWKMTMKRVFRDLKAVGKIVRRSPSMIAVKGIKRQQTVITTVGVLFAEVVSCTCMIFVNPALGLLLQDKSNECKQRNSVGSQRLFAFGFPVYLAVHIALWVTIYSHVLKKRRDEKLRDTKEEHRQVLQVSSLVSS
jgi:hypothetical protein